MIVWVHPWVLMGLVIPLIFVVLFLGNKENHLEGIFSKEVLARLLYRATGLGARTRYGLLALAVSLFIVALSKPVKMQAFLSKKEQLHDVVIAVDVSASMHEKDIYPSRLALAKEKLTALIEASRNMRIAVILYANDAYRVFPLSTDTKGMLYVLHRAIFPKNFAKNSNLFAAIEAGNRILKDSNTKQIVLLSDGGARVSRSKEEAYLKAHYIQLHALAITTNPPPSLQKLAQSSGGVYRQLTWSQKDIKAILAKIKQSPSNQVAVQYQIKNEKALFAYPLGLALLILFFLYHDIRRVTSTIVVLLLLSTGLNRLKAGEIEYKDKLTAYEKLPESPKKSYNIATMLYRLHHYKKAIKRYENITTENKKLKAKILYNIANAYIQLGDWQKAKIYLDKSLSTYAFAESKHNLTVVKQMLHKIKKQRGKGQKEEKIIFKAIASKNNRYKQRSSKYTVKLRPLSLSLEQKWLQTLQHQKSPLFIQKIPTTKRSLDADKSY